MRRQIIKIIQKQQENHKKMNTSNSQNIKSQFLNKTQRHSIIHHHYIHNQEKNNRNTIFSPENQLRKTKNLLNRVKSVRRIHVEENQGGNWDDLKLLLKDSYYETSEIEEKLENKNGQINYQSDWCPFVKSARLRQREQQEQKNQQIRQLMDQIRGLNSEIRRLQDQQESLRKQVERLTLDNQKIIFESQKMKVELAEYDQLIQELKKQYRESQKFSIEKLFELQQFIESLRQENEDLNQQIEKLKEDHKNFEKKLQRMSYQSENLLITIFPIGNKQVERLEKQLENMKLQISNIEKSIKVNTNLIKKQHEKEVFTLRNNYFKNLNFYRNLIKKWSSSFIADSLRQPQELLKTDLIELDQDLQSFSIDINTMLQKEEATNGDID